MNLYFVFLRRPRDLHDQRNDPFWEFGSFGKTGCHSKNLLHPKTTPLRSGDRLAFLQGGQREIRIIGVTPSISVEGNIGRLELRWNATYRPLPYSKAPLLIDNSNRTDFPEVRDLLMNTQRTTHCGAAGSRFRGRTTSIDLNLAEQVLQWFSKDKLPTIESYSEAVGLPDGGWCRNANALGWTAVTSRRIAYTGLGEANDKLKASKCGPGSSRSRC